MIDCITNMLREFYDINARRIEKVQGGWSADAYTIKAENQKYFLKVFDKHRKTAQFWINRIDYYVPIVLYLYKHTSFRDELIVPVFTKDGAYKYETDDNVFVLYPHIDGYTLADKRLSYIQQRDLAVIVSKLHMCGQEIPADMPCDVETFDVSFCNELSGLIEMKSTNSSLIEKVWGACKEPIIKNIEFLEQCAKELSMKNLPFVLCHTDLHGWNLMQTDKLLLLDWEGLKFAPVEADIFSFTEGFFFDYAYESFMTIYQRVYPAYSVNQKVMDFYRIRRRLEDIADFTKSILFDNLSGDDLYIHVAHLERECSFLN